MALRLFIMSPCTQLYDDDFGYRNKPNTRFIESFEGYSTGIFNQFGFNDLPPMKNDNVRHIFIVGDSYTEAFQLNIKKQYPQILEDKYNELFPDKPIDVIKLCRDGFMPVHYFKLIDRYISKINPELIVLQFGYHSGSDLFSNEVEPVFDKDNKLVDMEIKKRKEDLQKEKYRFIISSSALSYFLIRKYKGKIIEFMQRLTARQKPELTSGDGIFPKSGNTTEDMIQRFKIVIDKIKLFNKKIIILYIPKPGTYMPQTTQFHDKTFIALQSAAKSENIEILSFENEFKDFFNTRMIPVNGFINSLPGKGHLNESGHKILGEKLVYYLTMP